METATLLGGLQKKAKKRALAPPAGMVTVEQIAKATGMTREAVRMHLSRKHVGETGRMRRPGEPGRGTGYYDCEAVAWAFGVHESGEPT